jgi:S-formylglutathione hydrolase FrmB
MRVGRGTPDGRRRLRRLGVVLSSAALLAGLSPVVSAEAASFHKANDGARVSAVKRLASWEYDISVASPALHSTQKVRLIVPKGWKPGTKRTWPTVYAFHGGNNNYRSWTKDGDLQKIARKWQVLVVMPEGANGSYTNWVQGPNGSPAPHWETWHMDEVMQLMQRNFGAGSSRAAIGNSSGGQGAMTYAGRHPGVFKSVSAYSSILYLTQPPVPALLEYVNFSNTGGAPWDIWGSYYLDQANWIAHDPYYLLPRLRGTRIYVSSGTPANSINDAGYLSEHYTGVTSLAFVKKAKALHIPVVTHIYGGGYHSWPYWIREVGADWPAVMKAIGAKRA